MGSNKRRCEVDNKKLREEMVREIIGKLYGDKTGIARRAIFVTEDYTMNTDINTENMIQAYAQFDNLIDEIKTAIQTPTMLEITEEEEKMDKYSAIKNYRMRTGCDLITAKKFMDKYHTGHHHRVEGE